MCQKLHTSQAKQKQHTEPRVNDCIGALTHTGLHTHKCMGTRFPACTHTHTQMDHAKHRLTHTHARKVLPRRTSATLSSLKPAKYSPSAAVLSKLPTQARKRYQLPDREWGGQPWAGGFMHHTYVGILGVPRG